MWNKERILKLRDILHDASALLSNDKAVEAPELFPVWKPDTDYVKDIRVRWRNKLYRLIPETHHSQEDWPPDLVPAIWARIDDPSIEWPEWVQPLGSEDAYQYGAKVSHNGRHWINVADVPNVWEPGVYGWEEVS